MQKSRLAEGPKPHFFFGPMYAFAGGAGWVRLSAAGPMAPAVPRAPRAFPPAIPVAGSGLAPFCHFFCSLRGTRHGAQGPKQGVSTLMADAGEYGAEKVRFRAPQWTF